MSTDAIDLLKADARSGGRHRRVLRGHHVADVLCLELFAMPADAERFDAKTTVLIENVTHHIEEEEDEWFPQVRQGPDVGLGRRRLTELCVRLLEAKSKAPRSPAQPSALKKTIDCRRRIAPRPQSQREGVIRRGYGWPGCSR